jgi:hypothetical protein
MQMHASLSRYSGNARTSPKSIVKVPCTGHQVDEGTGDPAISITVSRDNVILASRTDMIGVFFCARRQRYVEAGARVNMQQLNTEDDQDVTWDSILTFLFSALRALSIVATPLLHELRRQHGMDRQ